MTYRAEEYYSFIIQPGFSTPEWAKGAVMYQIFVDRFYNGDPTNDVEDDEYIYIGAPCKKLRIGVRLRHPWISGTFMAEICRES